MYSANISYSIGAFFIILFSGCALNLLKHHYIYQLAGIAFLHIFILIKAANLLYNEPNMSLDKLYFSLMPMLAGISACLISMLLGFWIFPAVRRKFKE